MLEGRNDQITGVRTGQRAHQFSYTMKKVVGTPYYEKKIAEENKRVKPPPTTSIGVMVM